MLVVMGAVFLPLTSRIFSKFFDRGYAFSKTIAILVTSYLVWLLGSLKVLPFGTAGIWLVLFVGIGVNLYLFFRDRRNDRTNWGLRKNSTKHRSGTPLAYSKKGGPRDHSCKKTSEACVAFVDIRDIWKIIFFEELLFLVCLIGWALIRGFLPDIHGLEKFMDHGFVESILRSRYFPPKDIWLAGETINYYYFGHLVCAVLTKLSGVSSTITYNLMIAAIFGLCFVSTFSLGANLLFFVLKLKGENPKSETPNSKQSQMTSAKGRSAFGGKIQMSKTGPLGILIIRISDLGFRISNLRNRRNEILVFVGGLLSAALLTLGGNLHPLWYFIKNKSLESYWYPDATRFIVEKFGAADNTIHEFPCYSSVVADLHGHFSDLPFVLLFLALLCTFIFTSYSSSGRNPKSKIQNPNKAPSPKSKNSLSFGFSLPAGEAGILFDIWILTLGFLKSRFEDLPWVQYLLFPSLVLAVMLITNPWDFPIYGLLLALVLFWKNSKCFCRSEFTSRHSESSSEPDGKPCSILKQVQDLSQTGFGNNDSPLQGNYPLVKIILQTILEGLPFALLAILFSLPFHLNFEQIAQGVALVHARSPFWQLLVLWGLPWLAGLTFLVFIFKSRILRKLKPENLIKALACLFELKVEISRKESKEKGQALEVPGIGSKTPPEPSPKILAMGNSAPSPPALTDVFILILLGVASLLIIIPEVIYVKDIYIPSHHRANTMFKLTYQAFVFYALSTGYILIRVFLSSSKKIRAKFVLFPLYFIFLASVFIYPYRAVRSFYGLKTYHGLDGLKWMEQRFPDDYAAILWLRKSAGKACKESDSLPASQPVILEAVGESYTNYSRVSANTGLPTVLGWPVHEWLWRGSYDEPGKRREDVRKMYESADLNETRRLLEQYQVRYIFIGDLEREQYSDLNEEKFNKLTQPVFRSGGTVVYELLLLVK